MDIWYISNVYGHESGPYEKYVIFYMIATGSIERDTMIRKDSWRIAKRADAVFGDRFHGRQTSDIYRQETFIQSLGKLSVEHNKYNVNLPVINTKRENSGPITILIVSCCLAVLLLAVALITNASVLGVMILILLAICCGGGIVYGVTFDRLSNVRDTKKQADAVLECNKKAVTQFQANIKNYDAKVAGTVEKIKEMYKQTNNRIDVENEKLNNEKNVFEKRKREWEEMAHSNNNVAKQSAEVIARRYLEHVAVLNSKTMNTTNYPQCKERLVIAIVSCRKIGILITQEEEQNYLSDLKKSYELLVRAKAEKERQHEIKARMREEERFNREAKLEEERAEREQRAIERALKAALDKANGEHSAEVEALKQKLSEAEAKIYRAISMAQQTKAGFVYVISNIGSFGKNVFKIGMTRRLEPLDRVQELGDASVPFPFDVHAMIASDDAPTLENSLHKAFHHCRVNKINLRKEFFNVSIDDIIKEAKKYCADIEYQADAEAIPDYQSLNMTEEDEDYIETVFENNKPIDEDE